jgi:hypothetical protein
VGCVHNRAAVVAALSWDITIQSTPSHPISLTSILILSTHLRFVFPVVSFFWLSHQYHICIPLLPNSCYMSCLSNPSWLHHSNYTWRTLQIMKLLIMQSSPTSCHFIVLWFKYLLNTLFSDTLSLCSFLNVRPIFTPVQSHRQNYIFV